MKIKYLKSALLAFSVLFCAQLFAIQPVNKTADQIDDPISLMLQEMSVDEILDSSNKEIENKISSKFTFRDKVFLLTHKRKISKAIKEGKSEEEIKTMMEHGSKEFSLIAFLLGFFLSIIGVLIAYIFMKNSKAKWAWTGLLASLLVGLLVWLRG